jgi:hypothetical protein
VGLDELSSPGIGSCYLLALVAWPVILYLYKSNAIVVNQGWNKMVFLITIKVVRLYINYNEQHLIHL